MEKDSQKYLDWAEYESLQISLQKEHANILKKMSQKESNCKWIRPGEEIVINGHLLKKGYFYVGDYFDIPKSYEKKEFNYNNVQSHNHGYNLSKILGPVINEQLPIEEGNLKIVPYSSYLDMHPTHRYELISWLSEEKDISEISSSTLLFYIFGLQLRMFLDDSTDDKERLDIIYYSLKIYSDCIKYNIILNELELFINAAICYYFKGREIDILHYCSPHPKNESNKNLLDLICGNFVKGLNTKYAIPHNLITDYYINQVRLFVDSEITNMLNSKETTTELGGYLSMYYTITHTSGSNLETLLCYDLYLNIRLRETYQICYVIEKCVKQYCKDTSAELKDYHSLHKITPTLSYFALPSSFDIEDYEITKTYRQKLKQMTEYQEYAIVSINNILGIEENKKGAEGKIDKKQITSIIKCIKKMGYGIIPNMLVDEIRFNYGDNCVLYRDPDEILMDEVSLCQIEPILKVCVYIIRESYNENDIAFIDKFINAEVVFASSQRYLKAYLRWIIITSSYKLTHQDKSKITKMSKEQIKLFVELLVYMATLNYQHYSRRTDNLRDVLPLFNVNPHIIHTLIHRSATSDEEFATIERVMDASEYTIDKASIVDKKVISLNKEQLTKVEKQTKQAQELLTDIFDDKESEVSELIIKNDDAILNILSILLSKDSWQRNEVEVLCQERHLMLNFVLEQINDYSYNKIEDTVIEDDGDTIYIMTDYKDKLI